MACINLEVANHISKAFPELAISVYENFSEYCYLFMTNRLQTEDVAERCGVKDRSFLLSIWQEDLAEKGVIVSESGELCCPDTNVFSCLVAIYCWMEG